MHRHDRNAHKILFRKPERKRSLGRFRRRWEDNIRMDLRETEWKDVNLMHLAQNRDWWWVLVNEVMNLWVP
jgi:hypothetical protein